MKQICPQRLGVWLLAGLLWAGSAQAQSVPYLRITEVMTKATMNQYHGFRGTDFLEVSNFETNEMDLTGYGISDANTNLIISNFLSGLIIHPGESVILVNTNNSRLNFCTMTNEYQFVTNAAAFGQWWGAANLPANLQVRAYGGGRFSGLGDRAYLFDPARRVVDSISVDAAEPGHTFGYDPAKGEFGKISSTNQAEVFKASASDDYGSPGRVPLPVPLRISQEPASQTIEVEMDLTLTVEAAGMPPPRYQWFHDGAPLTNGTSASLTVSNVQPTDAGNYQVHVSNGSSQLSSAVATLAVNTNPYVKILRAPANLAAYEGQAALFSVSAKGVPPPNYQWQANGVDIEGAQYSVLYAGLCSLEMSGTVYSVRVWNEHQAVNTSAKLTVSTRPRLAITEIMALTSFGHADWFEVTNYGTNEVDLLGYRFSDRQPTNGQSFASFVEQSEVVKITNSLIIKPRESIIFVHRLSADKFIRWWGRDNLPPGLKINTYSGFALSLCGETLFLWNAAAESEYDTVAVAEWLDTGNTRSWTCRNYFYEEAGYVGRGGTTTVLGENGAWVAPQGGDIGSPGLTEVTAPYFLGITNTINGILLQCRGNAGITNRLLRKNSLTDSVWLEVTNRVPTNTLPFYLRDAAVGGHPMRFYRLEAVPTL